MDKTVVDIVTIFKNVFFDLNILNIPNIITINAPTYAAREKDNNIRTEKINNNKTFNFLFVTCSITTISPRTKNTALSIGDEKIPVKRKKSVPFENTKPFSTIQSALSNVKNNILIIAVRSTAISISFFPFTLCKYIAKSNIEINKRIYCIGRSYFIRSRSNNVLVNIVI